MAAKTAPHHRDRLRFLLNGQVVEIGDVAAEDTLLDHLRLRRRLTGTKEGCAEGDCGACTVLLGRIDGTGSLSYRPANACILLLAMIDGCHVVTIEHLSPRGGALHPVQQAMVDHHGSQCGFCTPGIVMSLYGLLMGDRAPGRAAILRALQGNLCRCTGYAPIIRAAEAIGALSDESDPLLAERSKVTAILAGWRDDRRLQIAARERLASGTVPLGRPMDAPYEAPGRAAPAHEQAPAILRPGNVDDLAEIMLARADARIVAGATDVGLWVTKFLRRLGPLVPIGHLDELKRIERMEDGSLRLGAGATYAEAAGALASLHPSLETLVARIGGQQIRSMGTIGGNIANGSPIGDMPPPFIALGATLHLRRGQDRREMPLEAFFVDYGRQDRREGEFVEAIVVPPPGEASIFAVHKVSKRRDEDITAVLGAFHIRLDGEGQVAAARIAYGGMAATPKRAAHTERALTGQPWTETTIHRAMEAMADDYRPLSDMRASADYRMRVAKNLLLRTFLEHTASRLEAAQ